MKSFFLYVDYDIDEKDFNVFCVNKYQNDIEKFINYLFYLEKNNITQIGFNNINFDAQVLHHIKLNYKNLINKPYDEILSFIYGYAQYIIEKRNNNEWADYKESDFNIKQIDLFKIHHLDNKAKTARLKDIQVAMNWHNVMDMPIEHNDQDLTIQKADIVIEYCKNDVLSTYEFYKVSLSKIKLRETIKEKYNINCINYSNTKLGSELLLRLYCKRTNSNYWDIKNKRTNREKIDFKDIIFDYITFKTKEFSGLLSKLKKITVSRTKGTFKKQVTYKGFTYEIGQGGIHGCIKAGVYESNDDYIIIDADVSSLYPKIAIENKLHPKHLGEIFCQVYKEDIVDVRLMEKAKGKDGDLAIVDGFKEAANAAYGNSNSQFSWLYDSQYTMQTTINGQLMLCMLSEMLNEAIDLTVLQINTDGITVKLKKEDIGLYYKICKDWKDITRLELETVEYQKMCIRDVNSYIAITMSGKIKLKGAYETEKLIGSEIAYYKDNSFRIIAESVLAYFKDNIPVEKTIINCKNIFMFTGRAKFKSDSYGEIRYLNNGEFTKEIQQKTTRYFVSKDGYSFVKVYLTKKDENGQRKPYKEEIIHVGKKVTIYNKHLGKPIETLNINYNFYIEEANKLITGIIGETNDDKQLLLF